ncbi:hypothetical protein [Microbacterium terricola]|uniref:Uncharacterized protein n=1 Tax=Microbacterium terricola TaxID=344163 RepID=A0ABM8E031_9MICO|nr:hypothetical protein [Microbacterium terricola]UYK40970.1 hypothetical protein OAU46_04810 [Microbacterium terricola]BDV31274.1 hypothetical protein Microterr_19340 [Microbacterium terricola]
MHPSLLETLSAWLLVIAFTISLAYELWRATAKAGTSRHDSMRAFLVSDLWLYIVAAVVIALLFSGFAAAAWVGLIFAALIVVVSVFYYNPVIMLERKPGLIDWIEDLVYTGLLFVVVAFLWLEVAGLTLA